MQELVPLLTAQDLEALRKAHAALENPSLAARISNVLGLPVVEGLKLLPKSWNRRLARASEQAIVRALRAAIASLGESPPRGNHDSLHRYAAVTTGALGGFFGLPALLVELPVTTALMLRAIADAAHRYGEDLASLETRLACMEVFALGGRSGEDDFTELGYYEVRAALAAHFTTFSLARLAYGTSRADMPGTVGFIRAVAARFGVVVSDKAAAQLVPVLGAAAAGALNYIFMQHFQAIADGHFCVRRLERLYGKEQVQAAYEALSHEADQATAAASAAAVAA